MSAMTTFEIIQKFKNGELKPNQVFVKFLNPSPFDRVAYSVFQVDDKGESLTYRWYDRERKIISNKWTLSRNHLNRKGYNEAHTDWNSTGRSGDKYIFK